MSAHHASPAGIEASQLPVLVHADLTARERGMLWLPWVLLGLASAVSLLLAGGLALAAFNAHQALDHNASELAKWLALSSSIPAVGPDSAASGRGSAAEVASMEAAVAALLVDPPTLLEHIEEMAAASGVTLVQFIPEPVAGKVEGALPALRLQVRAPMERVESFLLGVAESNLAIELSSLRLAAGRSPGEILCDVALRLHDEASLLRLASAAPLSTRHSLDAIALLPAGVFGPASVAGAASVSLPREGPELAGSVASASPVDPLAGLRLAGVLRQGDRVAALIDVPGDGPVLLHLADRLGQTRFRLESATAGRVVLADGSGGRRTLELDNTPAGAR